MHKKIKKGQAWGFDLMIASIIFISGIILFYLYTINTPTETEQKINVLNYEGELISNILLSEGFPSNWKKDNVISPGILSNNKINQTKLEEFYALSQENYEKTKNLFNTRYDYYIYPSIYNFTILGNQIQGIGTKPINQNNLIKISRIIIYKNKPMTLNIEIWD